MPLAATTLPLRKSPGRTSAAKPTGATSGRSDTGGTGSGVIESSGGSMRREFCTVFNANYLPRGLVLYDSLRETFPDFRLHVLCMDSATRDVLDALALPSLTPVSIDVLEAR